MRFGFTFHPPICVILPFHSLKSKELSFFPTFPPNLSPPPRTYETVPSLRLSHDWKNKTPDHLPILLATLPRKPNQSRHRSTSDLAPPLTVSVSASVERPPDGVRLSRTHPEPSHQASIRQAPAQTACNNVLHNLPLLTVVGAQDETAYGEQTRDCARYDLGFVLVRFPTRCRFGSASRC